jgi:hypothetical protein
VRSRRLSEMVKSWRGLCPAVDNSGLMIMNFGIEIDEISEMSMATVLR